jgi:hypothetical protein
VIKRPQKNDFFYTYGMLLQRRLLELLGQSDTDFGHNIFRVEASNPGTSWRNEYAFAALKEDGTVQAWGSSIRGGSDVPGDLKDVRAIYSTYGAFAALKEDGTVQAWGDSSSGGSGVPGDLKDVRAIYSTSMLSQL